MGVLDRSEAFRSSRAAGRSAMVVVHCRAFTAYITLAVHHGWGRSFKDLCSGSGHAWR